MDHRALVQLRRRCSGLAVLAFLAAASLPATAQTHPPGTDHSTHGGGPPILDAADFSLFPIPHGFFDPGSDPFTGVVPLQGSIVGPGNTDTSVRRLASANLPPPYPATDTIPIELVQLSLVSVNPITVTYGGGGPERWNVKFCTQPPPAPGTMSPTKSHPNGGTFQATFFVQPVFTFTRVSDGALRNLPSSGTLQLQGPWLESPAPNGASTGPNFFPRDSTLDFVESSSGSTVVRGGIAPSVLVFVPALPPLAVLALAASAAVLCAALLRQRTGMA